MLRSGWRSIGRGGAGIGGGGFVRAARAVGAALAVAIAALPAPGQPLNGEIRTIVERAKLSSSRVGVCVMDTETGAVLGQVRVNAPMDAGGGGGGSARLQT